MKAALYAVYREASWHWRTTLCWEADAAYWRNRTEGEAGLWLAQSGLSFGQAESLRRWLEVRQSQYPQAAPAELASSSIHMPRIEFHLEFQRRHRQDSLFPELSGRYAASFPASPQLQDAAIGKDEYAAMLRVFSGRHLLMEEALALAAHHGLPFAVSPQRLAFAVQLARLRGDLAVESGLRARFVRRSLWRRSMTPVYTCERCGSGRLRWTDCPHCGQACPYCEECLTMGRVRACTPLIRSGPNGGGGTRAMTWTGALHPDELLAPWGLNEAQAAASRAGLEFLQGSPPARQKEAGQEPPCFLIWAVTGAGKTEMMFPFLSAAIAQGGRALVTTPRKDVVLELSPRVQRAFPQAKVVTLYGGSEERWDIGDIVIATTHQLLRFREGFDVVVIDELDAFPFHNNASLAFAARKACKPHGRYIFLSATPPPDMKRMARRGRLPHAKVPVRYHRRPLPVPQLRTADSLHRMLSAGMPSRPLLERVRHSLSRGAQLFVFVPSIALVEPLVTLLRQYEPAAVIQGTSSKDPERARKVRDFREGTIRILVTTTILERGVTVPKSDVIVLDADSRLFDEASLVQMAGRAGRSAVDPAGSVAFLARHRTRSQTAAVRHIRSMNRLAKKQGYLS
jgi:competence protein ComFA